MPLPCSRSGGGLVLEVGEGQAGATAALLDGSASWTYGVTADLAGIDRVVEGRVA